MIKSLIILFFILWFTGANSQDIIIKRDGERVNTKVTNITIDSVHCKGISNNSDTVFTFSKSNLKKILLEIGSVYDFENKDPNQEISLFHNQIEVKSEVAKLNSKITHEIGIGTTGAIINVPLSYNKATPYQINYRILIASNKKPQNKNGLNFNYSSRILYEDAERLSAHFIHQVIVDKSKNSSFHYNIMLGLSYIYYDQVNINYQYLENNEVVEEKSVIRKNLVLPSFNLSVGGKYEFDNHRSGIFYEVGIGGPYILNIGYFFQ